MSLSGCEGALKDKLRLSIKVHPDPFLQPLRITQVSVRAENIGQTVLQAHHINERQALSFVELPSKINVGSGSGLTPSDGPVQMQMDNSGGSQLRFMST